MLLKLYRKSNFSEVALMSKPSLLGCQTSFQLADNAQKDLISITGNYIKAKGLAYLARNSTNALLLNYCRIFALLFSSCFTKQKDEVLSNGVKAVLNLSSSCYRLGGLLWLIRVTFAISAIVTLEETVQGMTKGGKKIQHKLGFGDQLVFQSNQSRK